MPEWNEYPDYPHLNIQAYQGQQAPKAQGVYVNVIGNFMMLDKIDEFVYYITRNVTLVSLELA